MVSRIRLEDTQEENQWCQESAEKTLHSKKKSMVSRIRREDIEEETSGIKNPLRRSSKKKPSPGMVKGVVSKTLMDLH